MTNSIITFFETDFITNEISSLLTEKKIKVKALNSLKDLKKVNLKKKVVIAEVRTNDEILELETIKGSETEFILVLNEDRQKKISNKSFKIIKTPFRFEDLFKKISNAFITLQLTNYKMKIGCFSFDTNELLLIDKNQNHIKLTDLECRFLKYLYDKKNDGSTKDELLSNVWGHNVRMETHTLESLVYRLRKKIENDPNKPKVIIQLGRRYILNLG